MTIALIALCIIGAAVIYHINRTHVERQERQKQKQEIDNWYRNRLFHIIVASINESDDSEYMRAAEEQKKLAAVGNNDVKVYTCVYRDDLGYHDETWEEYQARLIAFIKEKEAQRHAEIRKISPDYYRKWVLGKRLPQSSCLFLVAEGDRAFVIGAFMILLISACWFFDNLLAGSSRSKQPPKRKEKKEQIIAINGKPFKALPPPKQ